LTLKLRKNGNFYLNIDHVTFSARSFSASNFQSFHWHSDWASDLDVGSLLSSFHDFAANFEELAEIGEKKNFEYKRKKKIETFLNGFEIFACNCQSGFIDLSVFFSLGFFLGVHYDLDTLK
jgi:hypothetical protein